MKTLRKLLRSKRSVEQAGIATDIQYIVQSTLSARHIASLSIYRSWERCHHACSTGSKRASYDLQLFLSKWSDPGAPVVLPAEAKQLQPIIEMTNSSEAAIIRDVSYKDLVLPEFQRTVLRIATSIESYLKQLGITRPIGDDMITTSGLWATCAAIVPYDPQSRKAMRYLGLSDSFSVASMASLSKFFLQHQNELERARSICLEKKFTGSDMFILGMYLHQLGESLIGL